MSELGDPVYTWHCKFNKIGLNYDSKNLSREPRRQNLWIENKEQMAWPLLLSKQFLFLAPCQHCLEDWRLRLKLKVMTFWWTFCSTFCQIIIESFTLSDSLTPNVFLLLSFQLNLLCSHQILCSIFVSKFKLWNWISLILLLSP